MWEPSGNNSSPSVLGSSHIFPVRYRKKGIFLLDLLIYLIPPLVLLPFHARGVTSGFTPYFLGFTTLEFFGLLLIRFVRRNSSRKMIRGRTGATEIGLRFGLGLPLTVVFQVGGPSGFLAGFRLLPGILALFAGRGRSLVPVYIGLYAAGSIFFSSLREGGRPGEYDWVVTVVLTGWALFVLALYSYHRVRRYELIRLIRSHRSSRLYR